MLAPNCALFSLAMQVFLSSVCFAPSRPVFPSEDPTPSAMRELPLLPSLTTLRKRTWVQMTIETCPSPCHLAQCVLLKLVHLNVTWHNVCCGHTFCVAGGRDREDRHRGAVHMMAVIAGYSRHWLGHFFVQMVLESFPQFVEAPLLKILSVHWLESPSWLLATQWVLLAKVTKSTQNSCKYLSFQC